jgi:hypothetical protein
MHFVMTTSKSIKFTYQRLKFFRKAANKYPNNSFIKKVKVGNPTMTTQRI